ncbi:DNA replication/repair protein RecF [Christensenellaceae bacterium OttesenSCG-928-K19]|nr:DNA replication/repair protein RecF [Christensenellaceae bacterium OttesenSCG-928-K19]
MHITKLKLIRFRNYDTLDLEGFLPGLQMVIGKNAQGKTNLLEAIHICANGKSFRVRSDSKTIQEGSDKAYIFVEYEKNGRKNHVEVLIGRDRRKSFKRNGIPVQSMKEMLGHLLVVVFSPEDIKTAKESPSLRRAFVDGEISKIRPSYVDALKKYASIIAQKSAAIRKSKGKDVSDILRAYNEQLEEYIRIILKNRRVYMQKLNEYVDKTHKIISGGKEKIEIFYKNTIKEENISEQLDALIPREIEEFGCFAGPHRDDLEFKLNGRDVKEYASQGQLRTMMLSVKIACLRILEDSAGHTPVLLLDDVFSELDEERKKNLLKSIQDIQTFITTAERQETSGAMVIEVVAGSAKVKKTERGQG